MKICQINCVYGVGSTGKITKGLHESLINRGVESFVIFSEGTYDNKDSNLYCVSNKFLNAVSAAYRRLTGRQYDGAVIQTNRIISILKKEKPDVVHLQCINGNNINNYRLLRYLASNSINTVLTLHAEFMYTGGCGHAFDCEKWKTGCYSCAVHKKETQCLIDGTKRTWIKRKKCYELFDKDKLIVTAVSPWLADRAKQSMLGGYQIETVMNGVDTEVFKYTGYCEELLKKYDIPLGKRIVFFPTAIFCPDNKTDLKGGRYIPQIAKLLDNDTIIVVAANFGAVTSLPENVIYIGRAETQEDLAKLYNCASVTIVLSSRETFSMPTAESLCCGTPVVGFECGGAESIALLGYSIFCDYSDCDALVKRIKEFIHLDVDRDLISKLSCRTYSNANMTNNYLSIYRIGEDKQCI